MFRIVRKVPQWMEYAYILDFIMLAVGKIWVEDAKKSVSPDVKKIETELAGKMEGSALHLTSS